MARVILQCSKEKAREAIFYSYTKHINGFAANLDATAAAEIASEPSLPPANIYYCSTKLTSY
jgi:hypothetical protein